MLMCGVGAKSVAHLMKFYLLQWEVMKVKFLINSNMTLTVLNLHQKRDPKVQQDFIGQGHYRASSYKWVSENRKIGISGVKK